MAFLGSVGKFFSSGVGAAIFPVVPLTVAATQLTTGNPKGAVQSVQGATSYYRSTIAAVATGMRQPKADNFQPSQNGYHPDQQYQPHQYFQPMQFGGGSYDPNIGGGAVTWDSSTSWDWAEPTPQPTPGYSTIWD